jgi:hypothetical protein
MARDNGYYASDEHGNMYNTMTTNGSLDADIWMYHKWMWSKYEDNIEIYDGRYDSTI